MRFEPLPRARRDSNPFAHTPIRPYGFRELAAKCVTPVSIPARRADDPSAVSDDFLGGHNVD